MERPIERYLGSNVAIETLSTILRKSKDEMEEKFLHIAHAAAIQMHLQGFSNKANVVEAVFQVTDDPLEATFFIAVASESLLFSSYLVKNMMTFIPQYRSALNLPVPKTWSIAHLNFLRVEKGQPSSPAESEMFEKAHAELANALTTYLEDVESNTKLHALQDRLMQMGHREIASSAIMLF